MRTRLLVSAAIGLVAGTLTTVFLGNLGIGAADFNWAYDAARNLLAHRNPYAGTPPGTIPYPMPAVLFAVPFAWMPRGLAAGAFFGVSSTLLAFGLTRDGYVRLLALLSFPYAAALLTAQWSPLLAASTFVPLLLPLTMAKPNIGLPVALTNLSRRGIAAVFAVLAVTFMVMPSWLWQWFPQLGGYQHFIPMFVAPGFLLLLAALRYRDPDARFLLVASLMPQRWFYDALILWLIPKTRRELVWTVGFSWILGVWRWNHAPHSIAQVGLWTILWLYLPMLAVIMLRRPKSADASSLQGN